ncbi:MAG: hypothetical protein V4671_29545 [Armatimonadota bacterium]
MLYRRNHFIYRLLDAFFRHWPVFVVAVLGVTIVVATTLLMRSATYTATASIRVVGDEDVSAAMGFVSNTWKSPSQINAERLSDLMANTTKSGFVDTVLKNADLKVPIIVDPPDVDPRFRKFHKSVFGVSQSNDVFGIGLVWDDPKECTALVEALRDTYIAEAGRRRVVQSVATTQYLNTEIENYRKRLKRAEDVLVNYKINHSGQLPDAQIASLEQFANLRMERDYLSITVNDNALKKAALAQRLKQIRPTAILEQTIGNDPMIQELRGLEAKRRAVGSDYLDDSILARDADLQIAELKKKIASQQKLDPNEQRNVTETKLQDNPEYMDLTQQLTEANIAEQTQRERIGLLDKKLREYEVRIAALPAAERELTEKTRDYKLLQGQFEDLLKRKQQAELKQNVDTVVAKSAFAPQNNVYAEETTGKTKKLLMLVGSVVVGLVIGFALILFREWMDPSLRYETDAARLLGVPVLAGLPESPNLRFPAIQGKRISFGGRRELPPVS